MIFFLHPSGYPCQGLSRPTSRPPQLSLWRYLRVLIPCSRKIWLISHSRCSYYKVSFFLWHPYLMWCWSKEELDSKHLFIRIWAITSLVVNLYNLPSISDLMQAVVLNKVLRTSQLCILKNQAVKTYQTSPTM